jgi:hypothetical protein
MIQKDKWRDYSEALSKKSSNDLQKNISRERLLGAVVAETFVQRLVPGL